jgi:hypothetical protein
MNKYPKLSDLKAAGVPIGREARLPADARSEFVDIFQKGFK